MSKFKVGIVVWIAIVWAIAGAFAGMDGAAIVTRHLSAQWYLAHTIDRVRNERRDNLLEDPAREEKLAEIEQQLKLIASELMEEPK